MNNTKTLLILTLVFGGLGGLLVALNGDNMIGIFLLLLGIIFFIWLVIVFAIKAGKTKSS